jgi:hypothetical protein
VPGRPKVADSGTAGINEATWGTVATPVLTASDIDGLVSGMNRVYVLAAARWKDANNLPDEYSLCLWMQAPPAVRITAQDLVWHKCKH